MEGNMVGVKMKKEEKKYNGSKGKHKITRQAQLNYIMSYQ